MQIGKSSNKQNHIAGWKKKNRLPIFFLYFFNYNSFYNYTPNYPNYHIRQMRAVQTINTFIFCTLY